MEYKEIEFGIGSDIEQAVEQLLKHKDNGEAVYGEFNGVKLYSNQDTLESAFKKVTGKTKAEFDLQQKKEHNRYKKEEKEHKDNIPTLTKEWIDKGEKILDEEYHELWEKIVPIRLGDLYKGMELGSTLDIVAKLNINCDLIDAKNIIKNQGHSGMSYGLVRSMVKSFCKRGEEFSKYIN